MGSVITRVRFWRDHRWAPHQMSSYLDGELPADPRRRMERHIGECTECRRLLIGLRTMVDALGRLAPGGQGVDPLRLTASVRARIQQPPAS
jgi:anti-sigma factor RsiW